MRDDDIDDTVVRRPRRPLSGDRVADALDDTVLRPAHQQLPPVPADLDPFGDTVLRARPDVSAAPDTADTVIRPRSGVAHDPGHLEVEHDPIDDGDATVVRAPSHRSRDGHDHGVPRLPAPPADPAVPVARVPSVRVAGRVIRLEQPVLVGRRPVAPRFAAGPAPVLVAVPSPSGQVSGTHVIVHAAGEAAVVQDLRSTNGTVVRPPGGTPYRMPAGAEIAVLTGTVVEIGDGNAIEILSPHLRVAPSAHDLPHLPPLPTS